MSPEAEAPLERVARLWLDGDWAGLFAWAEEHAAEVPDRYWWGRPRELEWAGDHETDARHTYPNRQRLLRVCLEAALDRTGDDG